MKISKVFIGILWFAAAIYAALDNTAGVIFEFGLLLTYLKIKELERTDGQ